MGKSSGRRQEEKSPKPDKLVRDVDAIVKEIDDVLAEVGLEEPRANH